MTALTTPLTRLTKFAVRSSDKNKTSLSTVSLSRILEPKEAAIAFAKVLGKKMRWYCEETGDSISLSILEPLNKPVYCNSCGKTHALKAGEMDATDLAILERIRDAGSEDDDTYFMCDALVSRMTDKSVLSMGQVERFGRRWDDDDPTLGPYQYAGE